MNRRDAAVNDAGVNDRDAGAKGSEGTRAGAGTGTGAGVDASVACKRATAIGALSVVALGTAFACWRFGPDLMAFASDATAFRAWVDATGPVSRLLFVLMNALQVVIAFLPGEPLELAAGYAFGFWEGTLWCLAASLVGTAAVVMLVRSFGMRVISLFFSPEKLASAHWLRDTKRFELVLFLVFLIPGTPKDLLTYVAALGKSPLWRILLITSVGRIPSIVSSTLVAGSFGDGDYLVTVATAVVAATLAAVGALFYRRLSPRPDQALKE